MCIRDSDKTSAVHFLRFELDNDSIEKFLSLDKIVLGVNHPEYEAETTLDSNVKDSLTKDLNRC